MEKEKTTAIILAAGQGKRMNSRIQKQFLLLNGYPVLYYSLKAFQESPADEIVIVTGPAEIAYCQKEIVERYGFSKVKAIVAGGKERCHSVYEGLKAAGKPDYVFIHDGARPFVTEEIIHRALEGARSWGACVAGMPVKDTIKLADEEGFAQFTPDRSRVWMIQTPQTFSYPLIFDAYRQLMEQEAAGQSIPVTDDAMVLETMTGKKAKLTEGSYENIKITTPSDLEIAQVFASKKRKNTIDTFRH